MYQIEYAGHSGADFNVFPIRRPDIPAPQERVEALTIPGRDGGLIVREGTYDPLEIEVDLNFMERSSDWLGRFRELKRWLKGNGILRFSDDSECFYNVLNASISSVERTSQRIGTVTAKFVCDPYVYYNEGLTELEVTNLPENTGCTCHPTYRLVGEGKCTLTVNGNVFTANVGQEVVVNTELMLTYKADGSVDNTLVSGDYECLYLKNGVNEITVSDGFEVYITPYWRDL